MRTEREVRDMILDVEIRSKRVGLNYERALDCLAWVVGDSDKSPSQHIVETALEMGR